MRLDRGMRLTSAIWRTPFACRIAPRRSSEWVEWPTVYAISVSPSMNSAIYGKIGLQPQEGTANAEGHMDGRDQLRAGERAGQAVQRDLAEGRPLQPAPRARRRAHPAEADLPGGRRGGPVRAHRQGLRDHPR